MTASKTVATVKVPQTETPQISRDRRWYSIKRAALYCDAAIWRIRSAIWAGELPYIRSGKRFLLDRLDLDSWLERQKEVAVRSMSAPIALAEGEA